MPRPVPTVAVAVDVPDAASARPAASPAWSRPVHEIQAIRRVAPKLGILAPGIRLAGDAAGDQARVATPADAARLGAKYVVPGRSVTAAPDPAAALARAIREMQPEQTPASL